MVPFYDYYSRIFFLIPCCSRLFRWFFVTLVWIYNSFFFVRDFVTLRWCTGFHMNEVKPLMHVDCSPMNWCENTQCENNYRSVTTLISVDTDDGDRWWRLFRFFIFVVFACEMMCFFSSSLFISISILQRVQYGVCSYHFQENPTQKRQTKQQYLCAFIFGWNAQQLSLLCVGICRWSCRFFVVNVIWSLQCFLVFQFKLVFCNGKMKEKKEQNSAFFNLKLKKTILDARNVSHNMELQSQQ